MSILCGHLKDLTSFLSSRAQQSTALCFLSVFVWGTPTATVSMTILRTVLLGEIIWGLDTVCYNIILFVLAVKKILMLDLFCYFFMQEYVDMYADFLLNKSIETQVRSGDRHSVMDFCTEEKQIENLETKKIILVYQM